MRSRRSVGLESQRGRGERGGQVFFFILLSFLVILVGGPSYLGFFFFLRLWETLSGPADDLGLWCLEGYRGFLSWTTRWLKSNSSQLMMTKYHLAVVGQHGSSAVSLRVVAQFRVILW